MTTFATPLTDAYEAAFRAAEIAESAWMDDDSAVNGDHDHPAWIATVAADDARDSAAAALAGSSEPRRWKLTEEGHDYATITASSLAEALDLARANVDASNYEVTETIWIDVRVSCELTGECDSDTVALDPSEPDCEEGHEHDWGSPHEVVGGLTENPGVFGHGGGVLIHEVCAHCGSHRHTDTWAQRPDTGQQGLTSVRYEEAQS
jgi:hypothetical protein